MEKFNIWYAFVLTLFILFMLLGIFYLYYTNTSLMKKKGYSTDYIHFLKKDIRSRVIGIGMALPVILLVSGTLVYLIMGNFMYSDGKHMLLFLAFFFILVLPFPIIDNRKTQKKYRKLAIDTGSEVVLDFNFKQLHKIFNPVLEIPATFLYIGFMVFLIRDFHLAFIHLMILWILYFTLRSAKYMVKPSMKDAYTYSFIFLFINQALLIFYLMRETLSMNLSIIVFAGSLLLSLFLILKMIYYVIGYAHNQRELSNI